MSTSPFSSSRSPRYNSVPNSPIARSYYLVQSSNHSAPNSPIYVNRSIESYTGSHFKNDVADGGSPFFSQPSNHRSTADSSTEAQRLGVGDYRGPFTNGAANVFPNPTQATRMGGVEDELYDDEVSDGEVSNDEAEGSSNPVNSESSLEYYKSLFAFEIQTSIDTLKREVSKFFYYNSSLKKYKISQLQKLLTETEKAAKLKELGELVKFNLSNQKLVSGRASRTKSMLEKLFNHMRHEFSELQIIQLRTSTEIKAHINKLKGEVSNYFKYNSSLKEYKIDKLNKLLEIIDSSSDSENLAKSLKQNLNDSTLIAGRPSRTKLLLENLLQTIYKNKCINLLYYCDQEVFDCLEKCGTIDFEKLYDKLVYYKLINEDISEFEERWKPWMICFLSGNDELIQKFLNNNFDKNEINVDKDDPLHIALLGGSTKARQYVIKHLKNLGIDDPAQNFDQKGNNILIYAHLSCSAETLEYAKNFFKNFSGNEYPDVITKAFYHAAERNSVEVMEFLVNGSKFDPKSEGVMRIYEQALYAAATHNAVDAMKFLVELGVDLKSNQFFGGFAFLNAAGHCAVDAMKFLVKLGVDPNTKSINGNNIFLIAAREQNIKAMQYAVELGIDPNSTNIINQNALHLIAKHDDRLLIDKNFTETLLFIKQTCDISPYTKDNNRHDAFFYCKNLGWAKQAMRQVYPDNSSIDKA